MQPKLFRGCVVRIADDAKYNDGCYAEVLATEDSSCSGGQLLTVQVPLIDKSPHEFVISSGMVELIGFRNLDVPFRYKVKK